MIGFSDRRSLSPEGQQIAAGPDPSQGMLGAERAEQNLCSVKPEICVSLLAFHFACQVH